MGEHMAKWSSDRYFSILISVIAALAFVSIGGKVEPTSAGSMAASTYPRVLLVCIILISTTISFKSHSRSESRTKLTAAGISTIVLVALYIAFLEPVGFFILTPILLFLLPMIAGFKQYKWIVVSMIFVTLAIYGIFIGVLNIPLPPGILGD